MKTTSLYYSIKIFSRSFQPRFHCVQRYTFVHERELKCRQSVNVPHAEILIFAIKVNMKPKRSQSHGIERVSSKTRTSSAIASVRTS